MTNGLILKETIVWKIRIYNFGKLAEVERKVGSFSTSEARKGYSETTRCRLARCTINNPSRRSFFPPNEGICSQPQDGQAIVISVLNEVAEFDLSCDSNLVRFIQHFSDSCVDNPSPNFFIENLVHNAFHDELDSASATPGCLC
jgi:hypothetical protein